MNINTILDAMERNGYEKIQGHFIQYDNGDEEHPYVTGYIMNGRGVIGACAIGQAALNLNRSAYEIEAILGKYDLHHLVYEMNDGSLKSVPEIAKLVREDAIARGIDLDLEIALDEYGYPA